MAEKPGRLALHECVERGDLDNVKKLLEEKWPINRRNKIGRTSLHNAAVYGHTEIVKILISYGAKIDEKDSYMGGTPLHFCARGNEEIVKLLAKHGADIDAVDKDGNTPLQLAEKKKHAYDYNPEVEYFLRHARPVIAAQQKYLPCNQVKCSTAVKPKAKNTGTNTERKLTLNDCVQRGDLEKLTELLNDECPDDDKDADGWTPLCTALPGQTAAQSSSKMTTATTRSSTLGADCSPAGNMSQAESLHHAIRSCVGGALVRQSQRPDLASRHKQGAHFPVQLNVNYNYYKPRHVEVARATEVNCTKADVDTANTILAGGTLNNIYPPQRPSDDEDDDESSDDVNSEGDKEIHMENSNLEDDDD